MRWLKITTVVLGFVAILEHAGILVYSIYALVGAFVSRDNIGDGIGFGLALGLGLIGLQTVLISSVAALLTFRFRPRELISADVALRWTLVAMAVAPFACCAACIELLLGSAIGPFHSLLDPSLCFLVLCAAALFPYVLVTLLIRGRRRAFSGSGAEPLTPHSATSHPPRAGTD
jgi:hypothetical protein